MRFLSAFLCAWLLVSCGGGGGGTTGTPAPVAQCAAFSDSFGSAVTCAEMNALAGANLPFLEGSGGDGAGDGGADGGAGDGAPIANATLKFTDVNGKEVTTTTNATGYYRISLRGLKAPLVATVVRNDKPWKSMLVNDIVRAPANRTFYTINLTGLTDVVVSEVAKRDGLASTDAITPAAVARQKAQVAGIVSALNNTLSAQITAVGLNPATFNPLTTPFRAILTDSSDKLLESVSVTRDAASGFTVVTPTYGLGGSMSGLDASGLILVNGAESLPVAVNAATFAFATKLTQNTNYNVIVGTQPTNRVCTVNNGVGVVANAGVTSVAVTCLPQWRYFGAWSNVGGATGGRVTSYVVSSGVADVAQTLGATSSSGGGQSAAGIYQADRSWHADMVFGTLPLANTVYTATATSKSGASAMATFSIRAAGFNTNFPTNVQPSGRLNVTSATPVFTWSPPLVAGTYSYNVNVNRSSDNFQLSSQRNLVGNTVTYAGASLVPGTIYNLNVFTSEYDAATGTTYDGGSTEQFCFQCP
jgi:hypothetical protein